jgi:hypothetical protein
VSKIAVSRVKVIDIRAGDKFYSSGKIWWTAINSAELGENEMISVRVQYTDGGIVVREWSNPNHELGIVR